jgi:hypothetical protein
VRRRITSLARRSLGEGGSLLLVPILNSSFFLHPFFPFCYFPRFSSEKGLVRISGLGMTSAELAIEKQVVGQAPLIAAKITRAADDAVGKPRRASLQNPTERPTAGASRNYLFAG